jgi:hypothetical protein
MFFEVIDFDLFAAARLAPVDGLKMLPVACHYLYNEPPNETCVAEMSLQKWIV